MVPERMVLPFVISILLLLPVGTALVTAEPAGRVDMGPVHTSRTQPPDSLQQKKKKRKKPKPKPKPAQAGEVQEEQPGQSGPPEHEKEMERAAGSAEEQKEAEVAPTGGVDRDDSAEFMPVVPLDRGLAPVELIPGWRVQLASVATESAAARFADSLQAMIDAEIQVLYRDDSYKIQVGNFTERRHAEAFRNRAIKSGFPNAWVVAAKVRSGARDSVIVEIRKPELDLAVAPDTVYIEVEKEVEKEPEPEKPKGKPAPKSTYEFHEVRPGYKYEGSGNGYRIQIMALFEMPKEHAEAVAKNAQAQLGLATYAFWSIRAYKVHVGDFLTEEDAKEELQRVRRAGFSDAYIVRSRINLVDEVSLGDK